MGKGEKIKITLNLPACQVPQNLMLFNTLVCTVLHLLFEKKTGTFWESSKVNKDGEVEIKSSLIEIDGPISLHSAWQMLSWTFKKKKEFVIFKANICYRKIKNTGLKEKAVTPPSRWVIFVCAYGLIWDGQHACTIIYFAYFTQPMWVYHVLTNSEWALF